MTKKIIALMIAFSVFTFALPVLGATGGVSVVLNETFEDYAENSIPRGMTVTGINARVAEIAGGNRALYGKVWGTPVRMSIPVKNLADTSVFSFDLKITGGKITGSALKLNSSNPFFNFMKNGGIRLEDGYFINGYGDGKWHTYAVAVDFAKGRYDLYMDGDQLLKNRKFYSAITKPSEISMEFMPVADYTEAEIFVDKVRVWSGKDILTDDAFEKKALNPEVLEYELQTEKVVSDKVYIDSVGRNGLAGSITMATKGESTAGWSDMFGDGKEYIRFNQGEVKDCFADIKIGATDTNYIVFQTDLYVSALETSTVILCRFLDSTTYSTVLGVNPGGALTSGGRVIGSIPLSTWVNVAIICDFISATGDIYVNGALICDNYPLHNGRVIPESIRVGMTTPTSLGKNEIYMNKIKVYDGAVLKEFDDASKDNTGGTVSDKYISIHDTEEDAKEMLGSDVVFMTTSGSYFAEGEKLEYQNGDVYAADNGTVMVESELFAKSLSADVTTANGSVTCKGKTVSAGSAELSDGTSLDAVVVQKEGKIYLPAASFAKNLLGKYAYEDERGFVLLSDVNRGYSNNSDITVNTESIDIIYRYIQFDRPSGDEIYADFLETSGTARPRMFIKQSEIPALKAKVSNSNQVKAMLGEHLKKCDKYLTSEPVEYEIPDGLRLFGACDEVKHRLMCLGVAYMITDDIKYADKMWVELENCLNWKDWNINNHFLDTGEIGPGVAFAYDVLHNYMSEEQRAFVRQKVCEHYFNNVVGVFTGDFYYTAFDGRQISSNWGAVNSMSMLLTALTFMGDESEDSELMQKCRFVAENAIQSLEYPLGAMFPDGGVDEGLGYWDYYVESLSWSINALINMCGSDYSLLSSPGYGNAIDFGMYMQNATGAFNYSGMGTTACILPPEIFLTSKFYNNPGLMQVAEMSRINFEAGTDTACWLMWYEPSDIMADITSYPYDKTFDSRGVYVMRSGWTADAAYLGIVGGFNSEGGQFDKGSYIYDRDGVRWFIDMGKGNQNVDGGYYGRDGWGLYVKRTEGHNALVINPKASDPGQLHYGFAGLVRSESKSRGAIMVVDLSEVYADKVSDYKRGFYLTDNRDGLVVQDELELLDANSELYYTLHTHGDVTVNPDGKSFIVTIEGKQLKGELICDAAEWSLSVKPADHLFPENARVNEVSRAGINQIVLSGKASGKLNISIKYTPIDGMTYTQHSLVPIDEWTIPDGIAPTKPLLDSVTLNGIEVSSFMPTKKEFTLDWEGRNGIPIVGAYSDEGSVTVEQPKSLGDPATITVISDYGLKTVYTVKFNIIVTNIRGIIPGAPKAGLPSDAELLPVAAIYSDDNPQPQNPDVNAADGKFDTRWSSDKEGAFLEVDLGEVRELSGIATAFMSGSSRFYRYDILVSNDKVNYTTIYEGTSSGKTDEWDYFEANVKARYVRYVGYGHADGEWNSVTELRPCVKKQ